MSKKTLKILMKNQMKVTADTIDNYKKILPMVLDKNLIGHTFTQKNERPYRLLIKNFHSSTATDAIREAIESTRNPVKREIINARATKISLLT